MKTAPMYVAFPPPQTPLRPLRSLRSPPHPDRKQRARFSTRQVSSMLCSLLLGSHIVSVTRAVVKNGSTSPKSCDPAGVLPNRRERGFPAYRVSSDAPHTWGEPQTRVKNPICPLFLAKHLCDHFCGSPSGKASRRERGGVFTSLSGGKFHALQPTFFWGGGGHIVS